MTPLELIHPEPIKRLLYHVQELVEKKLWARVLAGMALGFGTGLALGPDAGLVSPEVGRGAGDWLALPGQLFLGVVQMIVVPLVFASIIRGLAAGENVDQLQRLGLRLAPYFLFTTTVAVALGLALATLIDPGRFVDMSAVQAALAGPSPVDASAVAAVEIGSVSGVVRTLLPTNPLGAMVEEQMLQVVVFSVVIGSALISLPAVQAKPLLDLLGSLQNVCMAVVRWAMRLAPFAVFGLTARLGITVGLGALWGMGAYVLVVLGGLFLLLLVYLFIARVFGGRKIGPFLAAIRDAQLLAFSTSSSAAVMPLSMSTAEEKLGLRRSVSQLVVPLGATINMDGTALYQAVATVFLASATGVELGIGALALVVVTAVGASIGTPSTPGVGMIILAMVITSVGIPPGALALVWGVDRLLDMSRTAVNVTGDLVACSVMDRWVGGPLSAEEEATRAAARDDQRSRTGVEVLVEQPTTA